MQTPLRLYYADIRRLMDLPGTHLLTPRRAERLWKYRRAEDRARCLGAGLLLRRYAGSGEPLLGPRGKPYFAGGPHFSLAHSGDYALLAVADMPVGTDIEQHTPIEVRVAQRIFLPSEWTWMASAAPSLAPMHTLWTAKESIMKATGAGIYMTPETIEIDPVQEVGRDASGELWQLSWRILPGHTLCVAYQGERRSVVLSPGSREELLT